MTPAKYERSAPIGRPLFNQPVLFRPCGTGVRKNQRNDPPAAAPILSTVAGGSRRSADQTSNSQTPTTATNHIWVSAEKALG